MLSERAELHADVAMTERDLPLITFYTGWETYQQRIIAAIAPLTAEQLVLRASPHTWPVGKIAAHIVAARVWWFHTRMGMGSADLAPMELWDNKGQPLRPAAELTRGLELTWQVIESALARWTPADLEHVFPARPDDSVARSRQWIIYHVLEHDIHHGGELSCILGAHGLTAVALE